MTKIGIYITGLGQSIDNETVEKHAERFKNELSFSITGFEYFLKTEKIFYIPEKSSTVVQIIKKNKTTSEEELVYKIYDFQYHNILTDKFIHYNIFIQSLTLFALVIKKFPQIILRLFKGNGFSRPGQTFYAFFILFIISLFIIFLIPTCVDLILNSGIFKKPDNSILEKIVTNIDAEKIRKYEKSILSFIALILLFLPQSKTIITSLATEFACVDSYINNGEQSQILVGNLNLLTEYIAENEIDPEIHFHCYSFGSIIAMDALFPIAEIPPSENIKNLTKSFISIGNPFEFINAYYPEYYNDRSRAMEGKIKWINIYSLFDTFGTNFRKDNKKGDAQFGIKDISVPENINYEIRNKPLNFVDFILLNSIKMHKCYWDSSPIGDSCLKVLLPNMKVNNLI
ncbi:hypothetical protein EV143_10336 [Flavobacterium chryseum]|uniref:hypothetical protein n=1 Tax=Flavobacterium sp. P3160 TaxID=2512113 RepID=UPI00105F7068|nr:hypothetical protein [Flavobacterium sp. P3160]TDO77804.1 hypothetical protein EV143_10336 [Flavobacterium sp. P3160]